jgi:hypothetical protein
LHDVGDPDAQDEQSTKVVAQEVANMVMGHSLVDLGGSVEQALEPPSMPQLQGSEVDGDAQLWQAPRLIPPPPPVVEKVKGIEHEATPPPQLVRTAIHHGDEFKMLEEGVADVETRRLRAVLTAMMMRIEVSTNHVNCHFLVCRVALSFSFHCRTWRGSLSSGNTNLRR